MKILNFLGIQPRNRPFWSGLDLSEIFRNICFRVRLQWDWLLRCLLQLVQSPMSAGLLMKTWLLNMLFLMKSLKKRFIPERDQLASLGPWKNTIESMLENVTILAVAKSGKKLREQPIQIILKSDARKTSSLLMNRGPQTGQLVKMSAKPLMIELFYLTMILLFISCALPEPESSFWKAGFLKKHSTLYSENFYVEYSRFLRFFVLNFLITFLIKFHIEPLVTALCKSAITCCLLILRGLKLPGFTQNQIIIH